jgi:hypothetical protein
MRRAAGLARALACAGAGRLSAAHPGPLAPLVLHAVTEKIEHFLADIFELEAEVHQHLGRNTLLLAQ